MNLPKPSAFRRLIAVACCLSASMMVSAQLQITETKNAQDLAKRLVGAGVIISNPVLTTITSPTIPTGFFDNHGNTSIGIDSGIVLTTGRAKTNRGRLGLDGNGIAMAATVLADEPLGLIGDQDLADELNLPIGGLNDAIALEFDFIPLGDTVRFNYVLSSEEYAPGTVCVYNDAFGFFISGPGILGNKNMALIPGTTIPVTITNVNNVAAGGCVSYPQYYVDNTTNKFFTHDGHTTVLTAISAVQPCQTYHLKLVIADRTDNLWDSGVFLQARSLSSNIPGITSETQTDREGRSYLAEGCASGSLIVKRPRKEPTSLHVDLRYAGTAINGTDVQLLPSSVTIPAYDSIVLIPLVAIPDGLTEGNEFLKVYTYTLTACDASKPSDSTVVYIKDFDTLAVSPSEVSVCKRDSVQLFVGPGFDSYQWNSSSINNTAIRDPFVKPVHSPTIYTCTTQSGTCTRIGSSTVSIIPIVPIFAGNDTVAALGQPFQLQASAINGPPGMQYSWTPTQFLDDPLIATPITTLTQDYWYIVTGTTPDGCRERDDIRIRVYQGPEIYVPSGFTPNNDGLNDLLKPIVVGIVDFKFFRVFNRWGQLVFASTFPNKGWDGKIKGVDAAMGTYVWEAEGVDPRGYIVRRKGVVTIIH